MSNHNWPELLQAQLDSGLSIEAFCRLKKLARSNFYAARARAQKLAEGSKATSRVMPAGLIPIRGGAADGIAPTEGIAITLSLDTRVLLLRGITCCAPFARAMPTRKTPMLACSKCRQIGRAHV